MMIIVGLGPQRAWRCFKRTQRLVALITSAVAWLNGATLLALIPSATSSNPEILTANNVVFQPNGSVFTVTLTLAPDSTAGTTILNLFVTEGADTARLVPPFVPITSPPSPPNLPPTLDPIAGLIINEDGGQQTVTLSGITSGSPSELQSLLVSARSSDPSIIPNPIVNYTSPNMTGSLIFLPTVNASGTAMISVTVNDGQSQSNLITRSFTVTVLGVNDPPTLNPISNISLNKNAGPQTVALSGITAGPANEIQTLSVTASSSNPGLIPTPQINYISPASNGTLTLTPARDASGSANITVTINDGGAQNNSFSRSFTVTVNSVNAAPTLDPIANISIAEDAPSQTVLLTGISSGAGDETQTLGVTATSSNPSLLPNPVINYASPGSTASLTLAAAANAYGSATVTVTVNDGQAQNNNVVRSFTVTVNPVNDLPTLTEIPDRSITQNSSTGPLAFRIGDVETPLANLVLSGTSSNPTLVPNSAIVFGGSGSNRTVTVTPSQNQNGSTLITITLRDSNGGTASEAFTLGVTPPNAAPTLNAISNLVLNEDGGSQTVALSGIGSGSPTENQTLVVTATSSNPGLIPNPVVHYSSPATTGTLDIAPVANGYGTAAIVVTVNDGQTQNSTVTRSFSVTVNPVNDPPTLNPLGDLHLSENAGPQIVPLPGIGTGASNELQTLTVTATSSAPNIIPNPTLSYVSPQSNGTLRFTPLANAFGTVTITVTVNDNQAQNNTISRAFTVVIAGTNSLPAITGIPSELLLNYNESIGPLPFQINDVETPAGNLTLSRGSSNPVLLPTSGILFGGSGQNRSVTLVPAQGQSGNTIVTITVTDANGGTSSANIALTVIPPNAPPTLDPIGAVSINEDAGEQITPLTGITSGRPGENQVLRVTASSSNPTLIPSPVVSYTSPSTTGTMTFTPLANASGSATISVIVDDGQSVSNLFTRSFNVTVNPVNDAPTLDPINDVAVNKNDGPQSVSLSGIGSGAVNENQTLTVTAISSDPALIPNPVVTYTSPGANGSLTFTPARDASGSAMITVVVNDGANETGTTSRHFMVTVNKVNSPPTLDPLPDVMVAEDSPTRSISLSGIGPGGGDEPQTVTITATSSNPSLIPNPTISYNNPATAGTLTFTPVSDATGIALVTVTLNDGQPLNNIAIRTFKITVSGLNDPPTISKIADRSTSQNTPTGPIGFSVNDLESPINNLIVSATSSNPLLVPASGIIFGGSGSNRTVTITPAQFQSGSAAISIAVRDLEGGVATETFTLTVTGANVPPTLNPLFNVTIPEDAGPQTLTLSGIGSGAADENQVLTITTITSNPNLIPAPSVNYSSPDTTGSITFQPLTNASGSVLITVRVDDGQGQNNVVTRSFTVTVTAVNDAPTISLIPNQRVEPGLPTPAIPFTIGDVETPAANLRVTATCSNSALVPPAGLMLAGSGASRTLTIRPTAEMTGSSIITVAVSDGLLTTTTAFQFTAQPGNTAPSISQIENQVIDSYHTPPAIPFTVSDAESDPAALSVTASSFNQLLMADTNIVVGGGGPHRFLIVHPTPEYVGFVTIALAVSDGKLTARSSFMITINRGLPPTDRLAVEMDGAGALSPDLNGQDLTVGRTYTMSAVAGQGQIFAGWSGGVTSALPTLSFTMKSNLVLRARFMTNPFTAIKGNYNGLFFEPDEVRQESSGLVTMTATDRGSFSGKVLLSGKSYSFSGHLDFDRKAAVSLARSDTNAVSLQFEVGGNDGFARLRGQLSDGTWFADLSGDRAVFNSSTNPAPFAGFYTLAIPGRLGDPLSAEGDGCGTAKVDANGLATFAGTLADGTKATQRVPLSARGEWPFYLSLYSGKGFALSWLTVTNRVSDDITGLMNWTKTPQNAAKYYPEGFSIETIVLGSRYTPPAAGQRVLDLLEGNLLFTKGNLDPDFVNRVALNALNKFSNLSSNKLSLTLATSSGLLSGTVTDPASGKALKFSGAVIQKQNGAFGFLLGTNRSSEVVLFQ
jgi:hypothetical protein